MIPLPMKLEGVREGERGREEREKGGRERWDRETKGGREGRGRKKERKEGEGEVEGRGGGKGRGEGERKEGVG